MTQIKAKYHDLRQRLNRRQVALLAILAIALSGTGLSSLALLEDQVTATVNASITTIDLKVNGAEDAVIDLEAGATPGDLRYAPIVFTNTGSGWVQVPSVVSSITNAGQLTADSVYKVWQGVAPSNCNSTSGLNITGATPIDEAPWGGTQTIDAGATLETCFIYRIGSTGATYTDGFTNFSIHYTFAGFYP